MESINDEFSSDKPRNLRKESSSSRPRKREFEVFVFAPYCKGCGICSEMCPSASLRVGSALGPLGYFIAEVRDSKTCNGCRYCERACPDMAITVMERSA